jgi:hypothetical protein
LTISVYACFVQKQQHPRFPDGEERARERKMHGGIYTPLERRILLIIDHMLPVTLDEIIYIETTHIFGEFIQRFAQSLAVRTKC